MAFPTIPTVAAGRVLFSLNTNPAGTHTFPNLSSLTKNAGDRLIAIVIIYDGNSTNAEFSAWGASFTERGDFAGTATMGIGVAEKISDGTEAGTFTVTSADASANDSCCILLSIPGAHASTPIEVGGFATGTAPDSAALNPAGWGTEDTLWIAVGGSGEDSIAGSYTGIGTAPTNYGNQADSGISADAVGGVEGSVAFRQLNAASEDPGTWSMDTSNARGASLIIAVRPNNDATATGAISVPSATVAGVGIMQPSGTGAISVPSGTVAGTGSESIPGSGAIVVPAPTVAGSGSLQITATGAIAVPAPTVAGSGNHENSEPTGTGAPSAPAATVAGSGSLSIPGSGAPAVPAPVVAGAGSLELDGSGAIAVPAPTVAGSGTVAFTAIGTGAIAAPAPVVAGVGSLQITGSGAIAAAAPLVAGAGNHAVPLPFDLVATVTQLATPSAGAAPASSAESGVVQSPRPRAVVTKRPGPSGGF